MLDEALCLFDDHFSDLHVAVGGLVEGRGDHLALHAALHVGDFLGSFVDQQDDQEYLGVVIGDRLGDVLQQHGLTGARRGDDQGALALALRGDDVDHPRALVLHRRIERIERQLLVRIERRQVVEIGAQADRVGIVEVDFGEAGKREITLAVAGRADLALNGVTRAQAPAADLVGREVDIVRPGEVVRLGAPQKAEAVLEHLDGADTHDLLFVFLVLGKLAQDAEQQVLPAHGRSALDAEFFRHRDQLGRGLSLEVFEMHCEFPKVEGWPDGQYCQEGSAPCVRAGLGESRPRRSNSRAPLTG